MFTYKIFLRTVQVDNGGQMVAMMIVCHLLVSIEGKSQSMKTITLFVLSDVGKGGILGCKEGVLD